VKIHHVALRTRDVARLEAFYAGVLDLRVVRRDPERGAVWLDAGGAIVMIERAAAEEPAIPAGSLDLVAFAMDDSAEEMNRWRARVAVEAETQHTLYFRDPDGRRVGVSRYPIGTL
jgi:catechol 2,3-dioxygenase-like lactoylglutathione lyase family enzyme